MGTAILTKKRFLRALTPGIPKAIRILPLSRIRMRVSLVVLRLCGLTLSICLKCRYLRRRTCLVSRTGIVWLSRGRGMFRTGWLSALRICRMLSRVSGLA
jgi:hypothetical protein